MNFFETISAVTYFDIVGGYSLYTVIWIVVSLWLKRNASVERFDKTAAQLMSVLFLVYFGTSAWMLIENAVSGWYSWIQLVFWLALTQLLWISRLRQSKVARLVIAFFLMFSFEKIFILITSFDRDYIPSSWGPLLSPWEVAISLLVKAAAFCALNFLYMLLEGLLNKIKLRSEK